MPEIPDSVEIEMEFSGEGSGWTVVTDVCNDPGIMARYGMSGNTQKDRVASTGLMTFDLNNGEDNSGGKLGYYSPGHDDCRSGFELGIGVRLKIVYSPTTYYKWRGTIDAIEVMSGEFGPRRTMVTCVDYMEEFARAKLNGFEVETNYPAKDAWDDIVAAIPRQPGASGRVISLDIYPYAFEGMKDEGPTAMTEVQRMSDSEFGYIYVKGDQVQGGTLYYESRQWRFGNMTDFIFWYAADMLRVETHRNRDDLYNRAQVQAHPRRADTSVQILYSLEGAPQINKSETRTFHANYVDPDQKAERVSGTSMVTPVADTDYTLNRREDGTGADITEQLSIVETFGGNSAELEVTNAGPFDGYVTKLQLRGIGIYDYERVRLEAVDTTSVTAYGESIWDLDQPYQAQNKGGQGKSVGQGVADFVVEEYKDPRTIVDAITFSANTSGVTLRNALERELRDRINFRDEVAAVKDGAIGMSFHINQIELRLSGADRFTCRWLLTPAIKTLDNFWQVGLNSPSGKLGNGTYLWPDIFRWGWFG